MGESLPEAGRFHISAFAGVRDLPQSQPEVSRVSELSTEIERRCREGRLPCAAAFAIARDLGVSLGDVLDRVNRTDTRIARCQLGLFGYDAFGDKRFVVALSRVPDRLADALREACVDGALPCAAAWSIAEREGLPRPGIGSAAEALGIRIAPCQLGCF